MRHEERADVGGQHLADGALEEAAALEAAEDARVGERLHVGPRHARAQRGEHGLFRKRCVCVGGGRAAREGGVVWRGVRKVCVRVCVLMRGGRRWSASLRSRSTDQPHT